MKKSALIGRLALLETQLKKDGWKLILSENCDKTLLENQIGNLIFTKEIIQNLPDEEFDKARELVESNKRFGRQTRVT